MAGFYQPLWLLGLLSLPVLWYLYRRAGRKKMQDALEFSRVAVARRAAGDQKGIDPRTVLFVLSLSIIALLFIGLADPHIPLETRPEGATIVFAMDVSGSMSATDYPPTRLDAAKTAAASLMRDLAPDDYAGIVIFEAGATSAAYLSPDKDRVIQKLDGVRPRSGQTALGDGLLLAIDMAESIPNRKSVVILLSDGVNNAGVVTPDEAVTVARDRGIQVFTVGMGSDQPVITGYDPLGAPQYATLDEETLIRIAESTGGKYFRSVDDRTLSAIYTGLNKEIRREPVETSVRDIFFAAALVLVCIELYLRYGKRRILP
jgi:Ca-activated chloride channel family protein